MAGWTDFVQLVQRTKISKPSKDAPIPSLAKPLARAIIAARMLARPPALRGAPNRVAERTELDHVRFHHFQTHDAFWVSLAAGLHRHAGDWSGADAEEGRP